MKIHFFKIAMLLCLWPIQALAYIDPGSGMLLLQGFIAAIGAFIVAIRNPMKFLCDIFNRAKSLFFLKKEKNNERS